MEKHYYIIDESNAKTAKIANSLNDYEEGSATNLYRAYVDEIYEVVNEIVQKKPHLSEKAYAMAGRYSKKLASYYNKYYANEASCPSILICGPANFPVKKKEIQNSRRASLMTEWNHLEEYADKIKHLLTMEQPILSSDEQAIELLEIKLEKMKDEQERMKAANKAIRKKDTVAGNEDLKVLGYSDKEIKALRTPDFYGMVGFSTYELKNNNANIRRIESRINNLKKIKEEGTQEYDSKYCKVVENTELMRLQLFFDGKPDEDKRKILKANGFRWSPKNGCWQRQLTQNAKFSLKQILKKFEGE
jgi:hypothetical protein